MPQGNDEDDVKMNASKDTSWRWSVGVDLDDVPLGAIDILDSMDKGYKKSFVPLWQSKEYQREGWHIHILWWAILVERSSKNYDKNFQNGQKCDLGLVYRMVNLAKVEGMVMLV
mgnify:CR=1 FL=1